MRTTIDIDDHVLADLKRLQHLEGKSLGRLVSDLLVQSLATQRTSAQKQTELKWVARGMQARVALGDHDAVLDAMDQKLPRASRSTSTGRTARRTPATRCT